MLNGTLLEGLNKIRELLQLEVSTTLSNSFPDDMEGDEALEQPEEQPDPGISIADETLEDAIVDDVLAEVKLTQRTRELASLLSGLYLALYQDINGL
jgi:hypothetical protein